MREEISRKRAREQEDGSTRRKIELLEEKKKKIVEEIKNIELYDKLTDERSENAIKSN